MIHYCEHNVIKSICTVCTPIDQGDIFEPRARSTDPETSKAAGRAVDAAGQRDRIMKFMDGEYRGMTAGPHPAGGWTADELDEYLGWRVTTAGRRLSELKRRGLVEACGQRVTRSNRMATVYRCVS